MREWFCLHSTREEKEDETLIINHFAVAIRAGFFYKFIRPDPTEFVDGELRDRP